MKTYPDQIRSDILEIVPLDGRVIGSIGCGTAATEARLVLDGREVHGVDISEDAILVASGRLTTARVVSVDDVCPFPQGSLDGLILADVLEHIPQAWVALASYVDMLRPKGWAVISVPNMLSLPAIKQLILHQDWPEHDLGIFDSTHVQYMTKARLVRWCNNAGLKIEKWFDKPVGLSPNRRLVANLFDIITFRRLHEIFQFQLQILCRRA